MKLQPTTSTNPLVLDDIIPHLRKVRITQQNGLRKVIACCPAHDDRNPSLSITETADGKLLWHCFAGCSQEAVQRELERIAGVNRATVKLIPPREKQAPAYTTPTEPLTLAVLAQAKRLSTPKLFSWNVRTQPDGSIAIPYLTRDGVVSAVQYRYALSGDNRFKWRKDDIPILYGLWRLNEWITEHTLYLTEGTTDCWTMWHAGLPAIGIPSATNWREEWWRELDGFPQLVLIPDTDKAGAELAQKLANTCPEQFRERVYVLRLPDGVKDVNELWQRENAEPERFREVLAGCEIILLTDSSGNQNSRINDWTVPESDSDDDKPLFAPLGELLADVGASELEYLPLLGTDGLIARGAITLIGAHPKAGKTTLLVHACREWVQQNLRVVYLSEDPPLVWRERVKQFPELQSLYLNDFTRVHPEKWVRAIRELEPDVVVVDTIRRFVPAKDENDSASVSVALAPLVDLQHHLPRTAIVLVHHTKKNLSTDGEITDIAGSHAYTAEVDAIFLLAPVRENKHQRILTPVAGRFWKFTPEPLVLELSESGTEYRVMGTVAEVLPITQAQNAKQKVLNAIQVLGKATADEVAEYLRASGEFVATSHLRNMLGELVHDGKLLRTGDGKRGNPYIYSDVLIPPEETQQNNNPDGEPNLFAHE
jgi:hypothetical protein